MSAPTCVAFSPDGKTLAVGGQWGGLTLYDTVTRQIKLHRQTNSSSHDLFAVVFSSDGKTLATLNSNGSVKLWDSDTLLLRASIIAHTQVTRGFAVSPDGNSLASGSYDGTVKLWDTVTGQERLTFKPPSAPISLAFSPDGNSLAIGYGQVILLHAATHPEARARKIHADPDDPDNPLMLNARGDQLWKTGNMVEAEATYRRALVLLERGIREYPDPDQARQELIRAACTLGALLSATGREHDAEPFRRQAQELVRQLPPEARLAAAEKLYATGESLRDAGLTPAATSAYALVTAIESDEAQLNLVRGRAFFALGQYEKAVAVLSPLQGDPSVASKLVQPILIAQYRVGNHQAVIETASKAHRRAVNNAEFNPLVLALAHAKRGDQAAASKWYLIGLMHLHRNKTEDRELVSLRTEAARLLGLSEQLTPEEQQAAIDNGRYLTLVIEVAPEAVWAYYQRGLHLSAKKEWERAIEDYSKAISLLPSEPVLWFQRARAYRQLRKWDLALANYTQVIELNPKDIHARNERGIVYENGFGNHEAAISDYSKAIELYPGSAVLWFNRGMARMWLRQWAEAITDFDQAIKLNRNEVRYWSNRGYCNLQLGRNQLAIADYTQAIKLDPKQPGFWQSRATAYYRLGEYDKAIPDLTRAIELAPKNATLLVDRANNYAWLGQRKEALADLDKALEVGPPAYAATVHWTRASFFNDLFGPEHRDPKAAMEAAKKALAIAPKNGVAWSCLGRAQYHAGDYKSALESLTKATDLRTDTGPHLVFRAMVHWKLRQPDEARRWYSEWAGWLELNRATWENNRPLAEIWDRYRAEAMALWGSAIPDIAPLPHAVPAPK
jgi:tetratricopeptide (TPR) repeat protein